MNRDVLEQEFNTSQIKQWLTGLSGYVLTSSWSVLRTEKKLDAVADMRYHDGKPL